MVDTADFEVGGVESHYKEGDKRCGKRADPSEGRREYVNDCGLAEGTREGRRSRGKDEKGSPPDFSLNQSISPGKQK
jgi:hypothetical protein